MKAEVKKLSDSEKELSIEVTGEVVKNKFEDVFKRIGLEARIKGFRPGHAPREMIEKEYSGLANEQVLKELIPELYDQAIEQEKVHAVDMPHISDVKLERAKLSFKATVEISPEIAIKNYKAIKIKYKKVSVAADEVKRNIDSLKERRKAELVDDAFAKALGYPSLAELEKYIERQLAVQKDTAQRQDVEQQVVDFLTKQVEVKIPQSLANKQLEDAVKHAKMELAIQGMPKEMIAGRETELRKELEPQARIQVKVYLILSAIAQKENIASDQQMPRNVMEFLFREADWEIVE
jgi:FKBP-type peptidyl-prolyl cis-trans isomerase (trigger factor)